MGALTRPDIENDEINDQPSFAWGRTAFAFFLLFGYLPLAGILNLCTFSQGVPFTAVRLALYLLMCWVLVQMVLVWPFATLVHAQFKPSTTITQRTLVALALFVPVLISFCYFWGGVKGVDDWHELILVTIPPVILGSLLYEKTRKHSYFSTIVAAAVFFHVFLMNDVLSEYPSRWVYFSNGPWFYYVRTFFPIFAVGWWIGMTAKNSSCEPAVVVRNLAFGILGICCLTLSLKFVIPAVAAALAKKSVSGFEYGWLVNLLLFAFLIKPGPLTYRLAIALCLGEFIGLIIFFVRFLGNDGMAPSQLTSLLNSLAIFASVVLVMACLTSKRLRTAYLFRPPN
ncbi:MAG: hypothetical protein HY537_05745 [Deltaproteobacteria bacterium]|nr:hypothetical protein [Deltaproteobacteria bacterium]